MHLVVNQTVALINLNYLFYWFQGIVPYLPYSKQSKMRNRGSIPAKLMADLFCRAGKCYRLDKNLCN